MLVVVDVFVLLIINNYLLKFTPERSSERLNNYF